MDCAGFHGSFLGVLVRLIRWIVQLLYLSTYIVFFRPIPELVSEDLENLAAAPSLLAVCVVCEVVGRDSSEAVFQVVWSWPRVAGGYCDFGRRFRCSCWLEVAQVGVFYGLECHGSCCEWLVGVFVEWYACMRLDSPASSFHIPTRPFLARNAATLADGAT